MSPEARIAALERRVADQERQIRELLALVRPSDPAPAPQTVDDIDPATQRRIQQMARDAMAALMQPNRPYRRRERKAA